MYETTAFLDRLIVFFSFMYRYLCCEHFAVSLFFSLSVYSSLSLHLSLSLIFTLTSHRQNHSKETAIKVFLKKTTTLNSDHVVLANKLSFQFFTAGYPVDEIIFSRQESVCGH